MPDAPDPPEGEERPDYTLYRGGRRVGPKREGRREKQPPSEPAAPERRAAPDGPGAGGGRGGAPREGRGAAGGGGYTLYRAKPRLLDRVRGRRDRELEGLDDLRKPDRRRRRRINGRQVVFYAVLGLAFWLGLSLVLFLVSAQLRRDDVSGAARKALDGGGNVVLSGSTVLVLGSDARASGSLEQGANKVGQPSRSDSIMLLRVGGGKSARLSIPRDTVVDIPESGRSKINAAYAIGGPQLAVRTVKSFLDVEVNHLVEVDFQNFPEFVDSLGGIDFTAQRCIRAKVDGGTSNGGVTIRFKRGQTRHLNGRQVLALSRIRSNDCNPRENDINRAQRQQQVIGAVKDRIASPGTFFRLPWVSWSAPKAIRSDMGGPSLIGLFVDLALGGSPPPRVLRPSGSETLPDGGQGLVISEQEKRSEIRKFLKG
ncbi:MAG: LCP family protein [Solirubrobacteraceae bacterium]